jgi:heme A synthase
LIQQPDAGRRIQLLFRVIAGAALVAAITQVVLGGVVRVTDSGLGCPDWPLCHGRVVPPFELTTLIEYSHRLTASLLTVLAVAVAMMSWVYYRRDTLISVPAILGLGLILVAAVLGGITVLTELAWWVVLLHLGLAESVVACMATVVVVSWRRGTGEADYSELGGADALNRLVLVTAAAVFLLILSGSYMVGYGAGMSCGTWPLCRGGIVPDHAAQIVHVAHRYLAAAVGILVIGTAAAVWARAGENRPMKWSAAGLAIAFVAQVIAGAAMVWADFSEEMRALHLGLATIGWLVTVVVALQVLPVHRLRIALPFADDRQGSEPERVAS